MRRAQISAEFVLVAVLILVAAFMAFKSYQNTGFALLAEATIKSSADWQSAKALLDNPQCGSVSVARIDKTSTDGGFEYKPILTNAECQTTTVNVFDDSFRTHTNGLVSAGLGCDYSDNGICNGMNFSVVN